MSFGPRFPDMSEPYDHGHSSEKAQDIAARSTAFTVQDGLLRRSYGSYVGDPGRIPLHTRDRR
jgi:hypothetical protein